MAETLDLVFVGTGVSTAIPVMGHMSKGCACYDALHTPNSKNVRNNVSIMLRRAPPKEVIDRIGEPPTNQIHNSEWQRKRSEAELNILFDCGKTFRSAYFNVLAKMGISVISALLITHEHADAAAGLDDLRDLIPIANAGATLDVYQALKPCPTYMTLFTLKSLARTVGYILRYSRFLNASRKPNLPHLHADSPDLIADFVFHPKPASASTPRGIPMDEAQYDALIASTSLLGTTTRRVTSLDVIVLPEAVQQFYVKGYQAPMFSFPVFHGGDYVCTAYAFGSALRSSQSSLPPTPLQAEAIRRVKADDDNKVPFHQRTHRSVVYLSDVSTIGPESMAFLMSLDPVDLLIVDLLLGPNEKHFSHWCFDDVVKFTKLFKPRGVYGLGMFCTIEHNDMNALLASTLESMKAEDPTLRTEFMGLSYDGLTLKVE